MIAPFRTLRRRNVAARSCEKPATLERKHTHKDSRALRDKILANNTRGGDAFLAAARIGRRDARAVASAT